MKRIWPASLRASLVLLVVICTLPAIVLVTYTAIARYHSATTYAYGVSRLASDEVVGRYESLVFRSHALLSVMAALPAINGPAAACNHSLAALRVKIPLYVNLDAVSLNGEVRCSAVPFAQAINVSERGWFKRVLATHKFTTAVISKDPITHLGLLIFSEPHFDDRGNFIGTLNAAVSPLVLAPPSDQTNLSRYVTITIFNDDGTVLMQYPKAKGFVGSDQSQSISFRAARNPDSTSNRLLPGIDGKLRLYTLRQLSTDVPGHEIYIVSGIDQGFIKRITLLPLLRDLSTITAIALFIILCTWWFATVFVNRRVRPILLALQRIGTSEWAIRTGLSDCGGEIGAIARGVDDMAGNLQARVAAQQAAEHDRKLIEQHYQELIELAVEGITVRRVSGEYVLVNAAFCKMLGYSREQLLRMRITDVIEHSEQRGHLLNPGESARFESWMYHQDGHRVPVEVSTLRMQNGDIQSVQRDIGERLEARRKLEDSERHYRELVEQAMVGILVRRPAGEILFVNEALCRMTGYSREELLRMSVASLVDPAEADAIQRVKRVGEDEILRLQSRLRHKDGSIIHEELSARRLEDGNIQIIINDITARVKAEQRFADERDFVFHALDTLPGVFYVFDSRGKFLRWNRQMEEITGYSQKEMRHITSADIVPPDRRAAHVQLVGKIVDGASMEGETELYCKDGARIPYHYVARHFQWHGQNCVVGMGTDIRERKAAEQRAQTYLDELQQLSERILNIQEEERGLIARELHDELGQSLTAVLLNLKDLADQAAGNALVGQIKRTAAIITQLTQQVRTLALNLRPSVLDDLGLAAAVRWYIRERVKPAGLKVELDMDKSLPRLTALIEITCFRVLQSALTNVLRHAQAQRVKIGLRQIDEQLMLTVHDDGRGFDMAAARRKAVAGKSFGLLGMEERARLAGGRLEITSNQTQGTLVRMTLPLT